MAHRLVQSNSRPWRRAPVKDWRAESAADLNDAESTLIAVAASLVGEPTDDQMKSVWLAYLKLEKSVAFVKVELDEENPGRFVNAKVYRIPDERQAILFALRALRRGLQEFTSGELEGSLRDLRVSRNYLRVLLRGKRRSRLKGARATRQG